jgi:hypothetical protein
MNQRPRPPTVLGNKLFSKFSRRNCPYFWAACKAKLRSYTTFRTLRLEKLNEPRIELVNWQSCALRTHPAGTGWWRA